MQRVPDITASDDAPTEARDLFDLTGRVALVTGGTRGLGLAIARTFASAGADLVIASRNEEACAEVAAELESRGRPRARLPVPRRAAGTTSNASSTRPTTRFGRVDVLVNNAGIAPVYETLGGVSEELFDKTLAVNLKGPFRLTALVGERMVAGDGGSIINVSSTGAVRPTADIVPVRRRQGRPERHDRGLRRRAGADGARQRDHARPVPDDDRKRLGHGRPRRADADVPAAPRGHRRPRSSAPRCTWPATRRATRPARS